MVAARWCQCPLLVRRSRPAATGLCRGRQVSLVVGTTQLRPTSWVTPSKSVRRRVTQCSLARWRSRPCRLLLRTRRSSRDSFGFQRHIGRRPRRRYRFGENERGYENRDLFESARCGCCGGSQRESGWRRPLRGPITVVATPLSCLKGQGRCIVTIVVTTPFYLQSMRSLCLMTVPFACTQTLIRVSLKRANAKQEMHCHATYTMVY